LADHVAVAVAVNDHVNDHVDVNGLYDQQCA